MVAVFRTSPLEGGFQYLAFKMCDEDNLSEVTREQAFDIAVVSVVLHASIIE